jgi:hypothetical protein
VPKSLRREIIQWTRFHLEHNTGNREKKVTLSPSRPRSLCPYPCLCLCLCLFVSLVASSSHRNLSLVLSRSLACLLSPSLFQEMIGELPDKLQKRLVVHLYSHCVLRVPLFDYLNYTESRIEGSAHSEILSGVYVCLSVCLSVCVCVCVSVSVCVSMCVRVWMPRLV